MAFKGISNVNYLEKHACWTQLHRLWWSYFSWEFYSKKTLLAFDLATSRVWYIDAWFISHSVSSGCYILRFENRALITFFFFLSRPQSRVSGRNINLQIILFSAILKQFLFQKHLRNYKNVYSWLVIHYLK